MKEQFRTDRSDQRNELASREISVEVLSRIYAGQSTKKVSVAGTTDPEEAKRRIEAWLNAMRSHSAAA